MEQTAVSWILIELQNKFPKDMYNMYNGNQLLLESLFLQAKQKEKERMIDFAAEVSYGIGVSKDDMKKVAEQYYNETYNK